jgi:putative SOS response-associated peptidase YedK
VSQYHTRMPVLLDDHQFDEWMCGSPDQAVTLLAPCPGMIEAWEVGADVGNVKNNRPELMERIGLP